MLKLYENIKIRRKALKMTQEELAKRTGYTDRSSIARIEKGEIDLPQSKILQFADALETTPSVLMGWVSEESGDKTTTLAQLYKRMRLEDDFYTMVYKMSLLNETQKASIQQLLNVFVPDE